MNLQDTRFMRFILCFWIKYQKFKGASRVCAIFLNCLLLIAKLVFCGVILVIYAPHLAANALLNRPEPGLFQKVLYVLTVLVSLVIDIPLLLICVLGVLMTGQFIAGSQFIEAVLFGLLSWALIKMELPLVKSLFCKSPVEELEDEEEVETYEEEEEVVGRENDEEIEDLPFCQLFPIGTEMCLLIDHVEMCPDETAFIRVVDEEGYTPLYKRKVRRDKKGNRFIVFNSTNLYLKDEKTQPIITKK